MKKIIPLLAIPALLWASCSVQTSSGEAGSETSAAASADTGFIEIFHFPSEQASDTAPASDTLAVTDTTALDSVQ